MNYTSQIFEKVIQKVENGYLIEDTEGFTPSFDMVCSSMDYCILRNGQGFHFLMSTRNDMFLLDMYVTINYQKFSYSYFQYCSILYRCLLYIGNTYICMDYLHNGMSQIQKVIEENHKKSEEIQEKISSLKKIESDLERENKAINLFENGHVEIIDDIASSVTSYDGTKEYLVNSKNGTCECKDHEFRSAYGIVCCHRIADRFARDAYDRPTNEVVTFADMLEVLS